MADAQPFEILSIEDKEQFPTQHGTTLQAMQWSVKAKDGTTLSLGVNRRPANPPPNVGETVWLETWENENGFMKGKRTQGPRQQNVSYTQGGGQDDVTTRRITRCHSEHMALLYADIMQRNGADKIDLNTIEAWTDHFDADVQRASGQAAASPSSAAPAQTSTNGDAKITEKQIGLVLQRQKMHNISDEDMVRLVSLFHIEKLKDLPRGTVDEFLTAMVNPIPNGQSDVPAEHEPTPVASEADESLPF